jgi:nucleoside-diphosphate-sugar epimerase
MHLLFGYGYLGARLARLWRQAGRKVTVVTRSPAKSQLLRTEGFGTILADVGDAATLAAIPSDIRDQVETVAFAVGYERGKEGAERRSIHDVYAGGVKNVLDAFAGRTAAGRNSPLTPHPSPLFLYISSTGVYGDADGEWVDETTPCAPSREGGRACLAAEDAIASHPGGARAVILRLAGIYGPGRIPRAEALRRHEPIDAPAEGYLNLIHVDDAARIVCEVEDRLKSRPLPLPRVYNVADGNPGLRREYYAELARLLDAPSPTFVEPAPGSAAAARAAADKRIANRRLREEIGVTLEYPSYREGLAAIVAAERASSK